MSLFCMCHACSCVSVVLRSLADGDGGDDDVGGEPPCEIQVAARSSPISEPNSLEELDTLPDLTQPSGRVPLYKRETSLSYLHTKGSY